MKVFPVSSLHPTIIEYQSPSYLGSGNLVLGPKSAWKTQFLSKMAVQNPLFALIIRQINQKGVCTIPGPTLSQLGSLGSFWVRIGPNMGWNLILGWNWDAFFLRNKGILRWLVSWIEYNLQHYHVINIT